MPDVRRATANDWERIAELLTDAHLPLAGARDHLDGFVVAERDGALVGCAAVEAYGSAGLLRSVAVRDGERGHGTGAALVDRCLSEASSAGLEMLVLLTTTAEHYFPRFGFSIVDRAVIPDAVKASAEFTGACPASAVAMARRLGDASGPAAALA